MAETDVLNAEVVWDEAIQDSIAPDYGWERLRRSQIATIKPAFGRPWSRTVGNGGHSTTFSWMNRSGLCVQKLKQWAEQHETGYFTMIDQDGGGRHYVGNFVGDMPQVQAGNDRYNIQGWQFEEIPGCPMVEYPSDWAHWSVSEAPCDDYGDPRTATYSATGAAWVQPGGTKTLENVAPTAGDWATHEYRGYGFQLWAYQGAANGIATLYVDGVEVATIDMYSASVSGPGIVYENAEMPLGIHRVKIVLTATCNAASTGNAMLLDHFQVMR